VFLGSDLRPYPDLRRREDENGLKLCPDFFVVKKLFIGKN
jgi:hypothetical protein